MWRVVTLLLLLAYAPCAAAGQDLFDSSETEHSDLGSFPKWVGVLHREGTLNQKRMDTNCTGNRCVKKEWEGLISELQGASADEKIRRVNSFMNAHPYIEDINNWGVGDYWEIVYEFLTRNGDCEDYALSKYFTLKRLGLDDNDMRIVVLDDTNIDTMHSVLAIYRNNTIYILDNQFSSVIEHTKIHHYTPIYSINEHGWWRHHAS